ncbi:MAG: 5'-nucleotidase C-terminal domain-containing protein [Balneolaceae bacterium]|nr:5'-nucleotidase C-terminal domain-containing protein [Balneolaceae bacterium]MCH8548560.1 5'-nucleotidase C-terminal domain-containing protein [Balneolaceae bacterium]
MKYISLQAVLFSLLILSGCSTTSSVSEEGGDSATDSEITYPEPDPEIAGILESYRNELDQETGKRVAVITDTLKFGQPEGALGNLVSDALRYRASRELRSFVNVGVIGEISFGLFLTPGDLTVGEVLEFMPYENHLVVLTLSGRKIQELANQIASIGGAPVSGLRFRIEGDRARGVLVNSQVLNPDSYYTVATTSWVANGGDQFPALWEYSDRNDLYDVDVRQLYIDHFESRREIYPVIDGRVR